ncbi:hypothetical protein TEA_010280 [Camellia sinensis var. sinensis]|uniref:HVA22-like protein n=1 Tax=Camellia sinensis var. sinensis TaxID=542762 RepID=A0A4S4DZZ0_CAMSN|nr:hypothetical protein TEA_010280 [Camellia sinensis var. sinensis]
MRRRLARNMQLYIVKKDAQKNRTKPNVAAIKGIMEDLELFRVSTMYVLCVQFMVSRMYFCRRLMSVLPIYASVQAIESNSNSDMRNLVAYWIVFSLISLFELAFAKLIEWLPFWPYMKLMAICWLGIPNFKGACYVYECLIHSCLSVNLQGVIKRFVKHKDDLPLNAESFLAVAERYVKENRSEELEKLIDRSRHTTPNIDEEDVKAVTNTEEKETATAIQTFEEPNVAKEDAKAVDPKEKILSDSTHWSRFEEPYVANENAKAGELNEKNPTAATEQVSCVEPNLIQTEKKTVAASEIIEKMVTQDVRESKVVEVPAVAGGGGENKVTEIPSSEYVQREWTACHLTTMCEKNFQSHLQGRKHKAKLAAEEKEIQTFKEANVAKEDAKAMESKEKIPSDSTQRSKFKDPNVANKNTKAGELNEKNPTAAIEQVNCVEPNLIQTEKKTVAASEIIEKTVTQDLRENKVVEVPAAAAGGGENKVTEVPASENVQREWTCAACHVTTMCEKNFQSHLQGRKHKAKFVAEEKEIQSKFKDSNVANKNNIAGELSEKNPAAATEQTIKEANVAKEDAKVVESKEKIPSDSTQWTIQEANVAKGDAKVVESKEKIPSDSTQWSKFKDPNVANKNTKAGELSEKNPAAAIEQKTVAASEIIEKTVTQDVRENKVVEVPAAAAGGGENKFMEIPASEDVQREWTCAACQVTTMCEKNFQSHLQGRKHKAKFAAEEKEIQTIKEANVAKGDAKVVESKEKIPSDSTQWSKFKDPNVANKNTKAGELSEKNPAAAIEQVNCVEPNLIQTEKNTVAAREIIEKTVTQDVRENKVLEVPAVAAGGGENKVTEIPASEYVQREWTCAACHLTTMCEKNFQSHLQGRKHKAKLAAEEKEMQTFKEANVAKEDAKVVESKEKIPSDSTQWSKFKDPNVANKNIKAGELNEKNPGATIEQVNCVEPNLNQTEKKTFAASGIIEKTVTQDVRQNKVMEVPAAAAGGGENKVTEIPALENVQREWTYAACQVTTMCEKNFQSHLQGRKHNAEFAVEGKEIQVKCVEELNLAQPEKKTVAARETKEQDKCVEDPNLAQTEKKTVASIESKGKTVTAAVRENIVVEVPAATSGGGENKDVEKPALENVQKEWTCAICQVTTTCEASLMSHLYGRKHRATCAELQASKQSNKDKGCSSSTANQEQPKKPNNQNKSKKKEDKVQVNQTSEQYKQKEVNNTTGYGVNNNSQLWCIICNVKCLSEVDVASHLKGKRHLSQRCFLISFVHVRLPFWPYMKLMAICWLGLPHFNGACYVYECLIRLIRPCLSANPQGVIKQFVKHKEDIPLNAENFLAMAEMYVKENESEALEKLIDRKSKFKEPNVAEEDAKIVEPKEKIPAASTQWSKFKEPNVAKENAKAGELNEKNPAAATEQVKCVEEPNLSQTEKKTVASIKIEEKTMIEAVGENEVVDLLLQLVVERSKSRRDPLRRMFRKSGCVLFVSKHKGCLSSTANQEPPKPISGDWINQNKSKKQEDMIQVNRTSEQCKQKEVKNTTGYGVDKSKLWCVICNVKCPGEVHMVSHLRGNKHLSQVQHVVDSLGGGD